MAVRVKQMSKILGLSTPTVRRWCNEGKLQFTTNAAGQRVFTEQHIQYAKKTFGLDEDLREPLIVFYTRSSNPSDISHETQLDKLTQSYGECHKHITDNCSGLKDTRPGLNSLIKMCVESEKPIHIYITNKDRLTRFGFNYLDQLFQSHGHKVTVLDDDELKTPYEILMQDFMSLLASFSGKFYRLRGWEQQKKFLADVEKEIENKEQK